jgi:O-methyltransferase involved in polyketide biosynthesis
MDKYHIEKNTVQETLIIPLYGRKVCADHYPDMLNDEEAKRICDMLDYDFSEKGKLMETKAGLFGALEAAQRYYDLGFEVEDYLKKHPEAAVVNLGCGFDTTFKRVDNGRCRGYNLDLPDVIEIRNELLPAGEREQNIACDLNDFSWFDKIEFDESKGAVFYAAGVFYYFETEQLKTLFDAMAKHFKGGRLVFDSCNKIGAKMMTKTWLREVGITDVSAYFSTSDAAKELSLWSNAFASVTTKSYMNGYREIDKRFGTFNRLMARMCDRLIKLDIVRIEFKGE